MVVRFAIQVTTVRLDRVDPIKHRILKRRIPSLLICLFGFFFYTSISFSLLFYFVHSCIIFLFLFGRNLWSLSFQNIKKKKKRRDDGHSFPISRDPLSFVFDRVRVAAGLFLTRPTISNYENKKYK